MTAVRTALRLSTVAALRDRTWAGEVDDSANMPIDQTVIEKPAPYISVFTDDDNRASDGMEIDGDGRTIALVIEFGVAHPLQRGENAPVALPTATDQNFELILDSLEMQITRALGTDAMSTWGRIWKLFVVSISSVESKRGASAEKGTRWAARQLIYRVNTIADPPVGKALDPAHPLARFIVAARLSEDKIGLATIMDFFESMLRVDAPLPDWRIAQGMLGITGHATRKIGIGPVVVPEDAPAPLGDVDLQPELNRVADMPGTSDEFLETPTQKETP